MNRRVSTGSATRTALPNKSCSFQVPPGTPAPVGDDTVRRRRWERRMGEVDKRSTAAMRRILRRLERAYGKRPWKCWGRGVDVLVDTILSQNTSASNSDAGYRKLRRAF